MPFCVASFDTHNIFYYNFLNNGPIFNLIRLLELSLSPLASYGALLHVYMVFTYLLTLTTIVLVYFVPYLPTLTTWMHRGD